MMAARLRSRRRTDSADTRGPVRRGWAGSRGQGRAVTAWCGVAARRGRGPAARRPGLAGHRRPARRSRPAGTRARRDALRPPARRLRAGRDRCGPRQPIRTGQPEGRPAGPEEPVRALCWRACRTRYPARWAGCGPAPGGQNHRPARRRIWPGQGQMRVLRTGSAAAAAAGQSSGRPDNSCGERIVLSAAGWAVARFPCSHGWRPTRNPAHDRLCAGRAVRVRFATAIGGRYPRWTSVRVPMGSPQRSLPRSGGGRRGRRASAYGSESGPLISCIREGS
jgi:hypothetical protein